MELKDQMNQLRKAIAIEDKKIAEAKERIAKDEKLISDSEDKRTKYNSELGKFKEVQDIYHKVFSSK